jgi:hypothetical protein
VKWGLLRAMVPQEHLRRAPVVILRPNSTSSPPNSNSRPVKEHGINNKSMAATSREATTSTVLWLRQKRCYANKEGISCKALSGSPGTNAGWSRRCRYRVTVPRIVLLWSPNLAFDLSPMVRLSPSATCDEVIPITGKASTRRRYRRACAPVNHLVV